MAHKEKGPKVLGKNTPIFTEGGFLNIKVFTYKGKKSAKLFS